MEYLKPFPELAFLFEQRGRKPLGSRFVGFVGVIPGRKSLGFAQGFLQVLGQPVRKVVFGLLRHRIGPDQGLVNKVFVVGIGGIVPLQPGVQFLPGFYFGNPLVGQIGQYIEPATDVFAPLGVVRRGTVEREGPLCLPVDH